MKRRYSPLALILFYLMQGGDLYALPEGGKITAGEAAIGIPNKGALEITQTTDRAIINWNQFNIAENEAVSFMQPGPDAVTLNRVTGPDPSSLLGNLTANGSLFFVNPHGIYFGPQARLDVFGLVATTLDIPDTDFMKGQYVFHTTDDSAGGVANYGNIGVHDGGFAFFVAPSVSNEGTILARLGTVIMGGVAEFRVDFNPTGGVSFVVDETALDQAYDPTGVPLSAHVQNSGRILADGGEVVLIAKGASDIVSSVINQSGIIEATSLVDHGGRIMLMASDPVSNTGRMGAKTHLHEVQNATGVVIQSGTLNVSSAEPHAAPGEITLSGREVTVSGDLYAQGTAQGGNLLVTSSDQTVITEDAVMDASGTGNARAGNIVIWSDDRTAFSGTLRARGGQEGGNGGMIEVSGFEQLDYRGVVNASAPRGEPGTLLLDPQEIIVDQNDIVIGGSAITAKTITDVTNGGTGLILRAGKDIRVNEAIRTNNPNGIGGLLTLQAGDSIRINADIFSDDAPINLTAGGGATTASIEMAAGTTLDAGKTDGSNIDIMIVGTSNSGNITLANLVTSSNIKVTHNGVGSVLQVPNAVIQANSVAFDAQNGSVGTEIAPIRIDVAGLKARSQSGGVFIESVKDLTVGGETLADQSTPPFSGIDSIGPVSISAFGNLTISGPIKAGGDITLTALGEGKTISNTATITGTGQITLRADRMDLQGHIEESKGSGKIALRPDTTAWGIDLGSTTNDTVRTLELSQNEINKVTTGVLQIGDLDSGPIIISAPMTTVTKADTLALESNSAIRQEGPITAQNLKLNAVGPVVLVHPDNDLDTLAVTITGPGKRVDVNDKDDLVIGDATSGIVTDNGPVAVTGKENLTIAQNIAAGTASVTLIAGGSGAKLMNNGQIQGNGIVLQADQMVLAGDSDSAIQGGTGRVTLQPDTPGRKIDLGVANDPEKVLALSDSELDTIKTTGTLQIGDAKTDAITISAPIDTANVQTVTLMGKGPVTQDPTAPIVEEGLRIESQEKVVLTTNNNNIDVIAVNVKNPGETVSVRDVDGVQIGSVDGETGIKTNGGPIDIQGRLTVAEVIEERFQSDFSRFPEDPFLRFYVDIVTDDFVVLPKPSCPEGIRFSEEIRLDAGC